eukprot:gene17776-biopygen32067
MGWEYIIGDSKRHGLPAANPDKCPSPSVTAVEGDWDVAAAASFRAVAKDGAGYPDADIGALSWPGSVNFQFTMPDPTSSPTVPPVWSSPTVSPSRSPTGLPSSSPTAPTGAPTAPPSGCDEFADNMKCDGDRERGWEQQLTVDRCVVEAS